MKLLKSWGERSRGGKTAVVSLGVLLGVGGCEHVLNGDYYSNKLQHNWQASHGVKIANPGAPLTSSDAVTSSFAALMADKAKIHGKVGLAYTAIGKASVVKSYGNLKTGPAWSTSKVPVAVAFQTMFNDDPNAPAASKLVPAITQSNNDAANSLWAQLGSDTVAAEKTQAIIRSTGDTTTTVPSQWSNRAGVATIFGQTEWSITDQARFAADLPCLPHAAKVIQLMGQISTGQRWGIGAVDAASTASAFKDGWASDGASDQITRQMAIVHTANGEDFALSMIAKPDDHRFATGQADITALANWAVANIHGVPKASC